MTMPKTWNEMTPGVLYDLLTKEGRSYGSLAKEYGVTRSVVSGQVHRWRTAKAFPAELPSMSKAPKAKPEDKVIKGPVVKKVKAKTNVNLPQQTGDFVVPRRKPTMDPPTNPPVSIMQLETGMCAVVVSETPLMYCGCKPLKNLQFRMCAYHDSTMVDMPAIRRKPTRVVKPLRRG